MKAKTRALSLADAIGDKKGIAIQILELGELCSFADFFVIATGTSNRHVRTLADAVTEAAREFGERPLGIEGTRTGRWILVDLGDIIVHLFQEEAREFFGLERRWGEAQPVEVRAAGAAV